MEVIFIKRTDGFRSCKFDIEDDLQQDSVEYYTIKDINEEEVEEIKNCRRDQVQTILNRYI